MKISKKKTEHLPAFGNQENIGMKKYGSQVIESLPKCSKFKYLGTTIQQEGDCRREVELRISKAWNKWRELSGVLCDKKMPTKLKVLIYKIAIRPTLLYEMRLGLSQNLWRKRCHHVRCVCCNTV